MKNEEFTKERPKTNNEKSDAELVETLDGESRDNEIGDSERSSIKAILDVRVKESTEKLNKSIEKLNKNTTRYSWVLVCLTLLLFIVTLFQVIATLGFIPETILGKLIFMGVLFCVIFFSMKQMFKKNKN